MSTMCWVGEWVRGIREGEMEKGIEGGMQRGMEGGMQGGIKRSSLGGREGRGEGWVAFFNLLDNLFITQLISF